MAEYREVEGSDREGKMNKLEMSILRIFGDSHFFWGHTGFVMKLNDDISLPIGVIFKCN